MSDSAQIMALIYRLGRSKNKPPTAEVADTYVELLDGYPLELLTQAIHTLIASPGEWFPTVGQIIAAMLAYLRGLPGDSGTPPILSPDAAWRLALLTIRSYQPQTRPRPTSNNPAVDVVIRRLGGVPEVGRVLAEATRREEDSKDADRKPPHPDLTALNILRRDFLKTYEEECGKPEHLRWVLTTGGARPLLVPGKEIPEPELERLEREAAQQGRALPAAIEEVAMRLPERAAVLNGKPPGGLFALLPTTPTELTPERLEAIRREIAGGIVKIEERMRLPERPALPMEVEQIAEDMKVLEANRARKQFTPQEIAAAEAHLAHLRARKETSGGGS